MSQPALIKRWSETSLILLDQGRTNKAFLMAWVWWKAYLQRVALVGLTRQGLSMADAQKVLGIWRGGRGCSLDRLLEKLFNKPPSSLPGRVDKVWRSLQGKPTKGAAARAGASSCKDRRNGLVHGSRTVLPRLAEAGVWLIRDAVIEDEVFSTVETHQASGRQAGTSAPLGAVLRSLRPYLVPGLTRTAVAAWLLSPHIRVAAWS